MKCQLLIPPEDVSIQSFLRVFCLPQFCSTLCSQNEPKIHAGLDGKLRGAFSGSDLAAARTLKIIYLSFSHGNDHWLRGEIHGKCRIRQVLQYKKTPKPHHKSLNMQIWTICGRKFSLQNQIQSLMKCGACFFFKFGFDRVVVRVRVHAQGRGGSFRP